MSTLSPPDERPPAPDADASEAPAPISAADRLQTRPDTPRVPFTPAASRRGYWRVVRLVAAIAVVAAILVWVFQREEGGSDNDLLDRLVAVEAGYQPDLLTVDNAQVARYIEDASGWIIDVPELPSLQVVGVGFADLTPQASVPAIRYDGADGSSAIVFAYDYVFLDSIRGGLSLPEAVYARLADDDAVDTRRLGEAYLVSWRQRAVVFTAVTRSEALAEVIADGVRS